MPRHSNKGNRTWPNIQVRPFPNAQTAALSLSTGFASTALRFNLSRHDGLALLAELEKWLSLSQEPVRLAVDPSDVAPEVIDFLGYIPKPRQPEVTWAPGTNERVTYLPDPANYHRGTAVLRFEA
jgi:hypothetical protein